MTRAEEFDDLVANAVANAELRVPAVVGVDVRVVDVPDVEHLPDADRVRLGRALSDRIEIFRKPLEQRAKPGLERDDLVRDVVAELLAETLGLTPEQIDPEYSSGDTND